MAVKKLSTIPLYREAPSIVYLDQVGLPTSGSVVTDAGWRADDTNPVSGSLCFGSGSLIDGDLETAVTPVVSTNWSIGIKLPYSGSFKSVTLYDSGSYAGTYVSGSNSALSIYVSYSNYRWGYVLTVNDPKRVQYSGSIFKTHIELPTVLGGRYLKLHAVDGPLYDPIGNAIRITEIVVREYYLSQTVSGSFYREYSSVSANDVPTGVNDTELRLGQTTSFGGSVV